MINNKSQKPILYFSTLVFMGCFETTNRQQPPYQKQTNVPLSHSKPVSVPRTRSSSLPSVFQPFAGLTRHGLICWQISVLQVVAALYKDNVRESAFKELIDKINKENKPLPAEEVAMFRRKMAAEVSHTALKDKLVSYKEGDSYDFLYELDQEYNFLNEIADNCGKIFAVGSDKLSKLLKIGIENCINRKKIKPKQPLPNQLCLLKGSNTIQLKGSNTIQETACITFCATQYALNGFIRHSGANGANGHYRAYVKRNEKWYEADDDAICPISTAEAIKFSQQEARLLFYQKVKEI